MSNCKVDKASKKKTIWKTIAATSVITSIGLFGIILLIMRDKEA